MIRYPVIMMNVLVGIVMPVARWQSQDQTDGRQETNAEVSIISIGRPEVRDGVFAWRYQIQNNSTRDVWICANLGLSPCELYLARDNGTLLIRRRLDRPQERYIMGIQPSGEYVRLHSGETHTELMSVALPVVPFYIFTENRADHPLEHATRVTLEIGYYVGDLPAMVLAALQQATRRGEIASPASPESSVLFGMMGTLRFLEGNEEVVRNSSERIQIRYTWQALKGEHFLQLTAEGLHIPYLERVRPHPRPDLTGCNHIAVEFSGSALDFLFPDTDEQGLLSPAERRSLRSLDEISIDDQELIQALAEEIRKMLRGVAIVAHGAGELKCYCDRQEMASLTVYGGSYVLDDQGQVFRCPDRLSNLRKSVPLIRSLDLRIHCARNLDHLRYRLRALHSLGEYPTPKQWCDDIVNILVNDGWPKSVIMRAFRCETETGGRSSYAMNPSCGPDSPADMVLLFETNAGWNQHGGPELFTFDNHDPKGGLVLLNDGTVKFIRTEEELRQLRWK